MEINRRSWKKERDENTERERERMRGREGGTVKRPLSRGARGSAVPLIIDVAGNLRRQETELPAVPPHYDITREGRPTAGAVSRHPSRPVAPAARLLTRPQTNAHVLHVAFQTVAHDAALSPGSATEGKGRERKGKGGLGWVGKHVDRRSPVDLTFVSKGNEEGRIKA